MAAWGAQGDSPWHGGGRGHRSGQGDPRPVPTLGCDHQPSPTHFPTPQQSSFPRPCPVWPPPICSSPGRGRGGTGEEKEAHRGAGSPRAELEPGRSQEKLFLQWSWKIHWRGHGRDEPPHPAGTEPPGLGTLCAWPGAQPSTTARAVGTRTCCTSDQKVQNQKYNGKSKNSGFNPSPMGDTVPAWKPSSPSFWSKDVTLVTQELREVLREPLCSWAPPALSLASVYIYIFIYLSLSISLSHAALGMEEEQTAKQEVRMGAPICREQGHPGPRHPKAHSHTALTSTSGFFLAYILQQYRTSLPYPEPWRSRSSGTGADPVPAGAAVLEPTALSQPGAQAGQPGSGGSLGAAYSSHHPLACMGYPSVLPGLGVPPVWAGRAGGPCPLCHCCPTGAL